MLSISHGVGALLSDYNFGTRLEVHLYLFNRKVQHGTVFEITPKPANEDKEEEEKSTFEPAKLMKNLRLDLLGGDEEDPDSEITLPFERIASSMQPITKDRGVLKKVLKSGVGPVVSPGSGVCFHYNAYLEMADEPFDSTQLRGRPFRCLYVVFS
ncbi:hypothetical protein HPB51_000872 [Rhipicephalus microplus]|uniref:Uncharacterized protein n=1 Tax=Rhipicephalus microplus TaxID=6941 RepID=A0A9J6D7Q6_RHIMP|nr:hypothetical protein HPB51_000872 [Rhipicephalus microplus]